MTPFLYFIGVPGVAGAGVVAGAAAGAAGLVIGTPLYFTAAG